MAQPILILSSLIFTVKLLLLTMSRPNRSFLFFTAEPFGAKSQEEDAEILCGEHRWRRKIKSRQQLQSTAYRASSGTAFCTFSEFLKISIWVLKTCRTKTLREKLSEQIAAAQESSRHQPFQSVLDKTASPSTAMQFSTENNRFDNQTTTSLFSC